MNEFYCMDLSAYFNHKLIAIENCIDRVKSKHANCGISDDGNTDGVFYEPSSLPNSLECIRVNDVIFNFPDKSIDLLDNISCEGDVIIIPEISCSSVCFLGLSESANLLDKVKLTYLDGINEEINLLLYKWNKGKRLYITDISDEECKVALQSNTENTSTRYIYSFESNVMATEKKVTSIELPYNPCLHILAITLKTVR